MDLEVPDQCSVDSLLKAFTTGYPETKGLGPVLVAVNQEIGGPDTRLKQEDDVALLPPVSGG